MKDYLKKLIDARDKASIRRFITLLISFHFILASFVILFFNFAILIWMPKGKIDIALLDSLNNILEKDFYIMLVGLGLITVDGLYNLLLARINAASNQPPPNNNPPQPPV